MKKGKLVFDQYRRSWRRYPPEVDKRDVLFASCFMFVLAIIMVIIVKHYS